MSSKLTTLLAGVDDFDARVEIWRGFCKTNSVSGLVPGEILDLEWSDRDKADVAADFQVKASQFKIERAAIADAIKVHAELMAAHALELDALGGAELDVRGVTP
jgi:hypothetical protein